MVYLCDLDGKLRHMDLHHHRNHHYSKQSEGFSYLPTPTDSLSGHEEDTRPNTNVNSFSAALACYPIVSALAANLDLNSLHNLSRTCRQFRGTLLLYRDQLVSRTLRCSNETTQPEPSKRHLMKVGLDFSAAASEHRLLTRRSIGRLTSGKVSKCARDLVRDCRNCGTIICRNCSSKPPPFFALRGRHRRLCSTCLRAPLDVHLEARSTTNPIDLPPCRKKSQSSWDETARSSSESSWTSPTRLQQNRRLTSSSYNSFSGDAFIQSPPKRNLTYLAFKRTPCTCSRYNHLCGPCGSELVAHDRDYERGWIWRNKYSAYVGVAEGNKGVECGRRSACLAARYVEQETDCDPETLEAAHRGEDEATTLGRTWEGGSFVMQEVEGIGGVVKMKVKTLVLVGAEVDGLEDDVSDDEYKKKGDKKDLFKGERSWCSWCERVVPGASDVWNHAWDIGGDAR